MLLKFGGHVRDCRRRRDAMGRLMPLSDLVLAVREAFYRKVRGLNTRGSETDLTPLSTGQRLGKPNGGRISERYLAGFVDAEGSIMMARFRSGRYGTVNYRGRMTVANTNKILKAIQEEYGGILTEDPRAKPTWKRAFQLIWVHEGITRVLMTVRPFLVVKAHRQNFSLTSSSM